MTVVAVFSTAVPMEVVLESGGNGDVGHVTVQLHWIGWLPLLLGSHVGHQVADTLAVGKLVIVPVETQRHR